MSRCAVPSSSQERPPGRSTTSFAILGLLSLGPWTSYALAKQVRRSLNWMWPRAERRLYDEPPRLVADGLATATSDSTGRRPRTVYEITDAGRTALRDWLDEPPAPRSTEFAGMLKVFFADAGSLAQLDASLTAIEQEARARLSALAQMAGESVAATAPFPERRHLNAIGLRMQVDQEVEMLRWARWAREQASTWAGPDDPGAWDAHAVQEQTLARARAQLESP